jgi:hypothetical protein
MSTSNRLNTVAPDLVELGKSLSAAQRKAVAYRAAGWACRMTGAITYLLHDRLQYIPDISRSATQQERQSIASAVENLDEKYFAIVEEHGGLDDTGQAMQWFRKARAAASLLYALDSSTVDDFCEALYEAQAATADLDGLRLLCTSVS